MRTYLENTPITVEHVDNGLTFEIVVTVFCGSDSASVRIVNYHTNIVHIEHNGEVLLDIPVEGESEAGLTDRSCLNLKDILDFAIPWTLRTSKMFWTGRSGTTVPSPKKACGAITAPTSAACFCRPTAMTM